MATHHFQPTHYHITLGTHAPVLSIAPGDTVVTTTLSAYGTDEHGRQVARDSNPQTGPFFIKGAEPGDTLVMHLDRLAPNRASGLGHGVLAANTVDPDYVPRLPWEHASEDIEWQLDLDAGMATLPQAGPRLGDLALPLAPMLGCFGVAPAEGEAISTATSGRHGGNMDYRGFVQGVTVYFPVFAPGALLFLGDGHALQGDGEMAGTGIEVPFVAQFTVDLRKGYRIGWPRGENTSYIFTLGNARPLDQAVQHATTEMLRWLQADYGLTAREASVLLGYCVEYDLGNMFDPAYTMVCKLAKRWLPGNDR
jgi:acetamidase/formamidase